MTASTEELAAIKTQQGEDARRHSQSLVAAKSALDEVPTPVKCVVTDNYRRGLIEVPTVRERRRRVEQTHRQPGETMGTYDTRKKALRL